MISIGTEVAHQICSRVIMSDHSIVSNQTKAESWYYVDYHVWTPLVLRVRSMVSVNVISQVGSDMMFLR